MAVVGTPKKHAGFLHPIGLVTRQPAVKTEFLSVDFKLNDCEQSDVSIAEPSRESALDSYLVFARAGSGAAGSTLSELAASTGWDLVMCSTSGCSRSKS